MFVRLLDILRLSGLSASVPKWPYSKALKADIFNLSAYVRRVREADGQDTSL